MMNPNNTAEAQEPAPTPPSTAAAAADDPDVIETRFGKMKFDRDNAVYLPRGIFGYADFHDFALADLPDPKLEQFKLLQSLTEPTLSFIVAPADLENNTIETADIEDACKMLSIAPEDAAVLLIVATRKLGAETQVSVNLRAPIIVDTRTQNGWQYVLHNGSYPVRHVLTQGVRNSDQTADQAAVE